MDNDSNIGKKYWEHSTLFAWLVCFLATIFYCYDFLLRVMPSVMLHPLMNFYSANAAQIGLLSAFYYYAYTPLQLPAGIILDKYRPHIVLSVSALICAVGTMIFAMVDSYIVANIARAMMGAGSAFAFIGALKLAAIWLPEKHFALFAGLTSAMGTFGAILADNALSYMVSDLGWQRSAYISGFIGIVITILLFVIIKDKRKQPDSVTVDNTWSSFLNRILLLARHPHIWINGLVGLALFLPISVFASLWGVDFIARRYHLLNAHAASAVSLVFIGMAIAAPVFGYLSERIERRRRILFLGNALCIGLISMLIYSEHTSLTLAYFLLFFIGVSTGPQVLVFAIAKDLGPPLTTGIATALTNFLVTMGAALFQPFIGYALDYHWSGTTTSIGTPLFSVNDYRFALSLLVIALTACLMLIYFLPSYQQSKMKNQH